ncbi:DUF2059 domain-containing protein [Celeribacter indicus]|nr:DUF2059 domain-containing protein [Celeribacter indicus]SDW03489.1 hypothetical protein SAMN05443573_101165 [Celeribacter indicus]
MFTLPRGLAALTLAAGLALPLHAETREERLAVAEDYTEMAVEDMDMERIIEQMYTPILPQIEASTGESLSEEQRSEIHRIYMDNLADPMREVMNGQAEVMADQFTIEEITALRDFYGTEEGRSVMRKMPDVLAAVQPDIMQMVQTKMPDIMAEVQTVVAPE